VMLDGRAEMDFDRECDAERYAAGLRAEINS
jgi:hypothetical protein